MRHRVGPAAVFGLLVLSGTLSAQTVSQSTLTGTVTSASTSIAPSSSTPVFTVPAGTFFVLTEACFTRPDQITLTGNTFGEVTHSLRRRRKCTQYRPGIALSANEVLSCASIAAVATQWCTVTGDLVAR